LNQTDTQPIERTTRRFNTLKVPRKLQASLPYASKNKAMAPQKKPTYLQKRAVIMEPEEKKAVALLQQIQALKKDKAARRKEKQNERVAEHRKEQAKVDESKMDKRKDERKERLKSASIKNKRAAESQGGRGKRKREA
jgi:ribosome biogenesis protein BMS1